MVDKKCVPLKAKGQRKQSAHGMQAYKGITWHEPCNYASNVAYYHSSVELCLTKQHLVMSEASRNGVGGMTGILAWGSAFMHGSQTSLGGTADVKGMDVMLYILHQAAHEHLQVSHAVADLQASGPRSDLIMKSRCKTI